MKKVLFDKKENNAADTLEERIVECESCDILASKDLRQMSMDKMQKLLVLTKDQHNIFQLHVKAKIAEHYLCVSTMVDLTKALETRLAVWVRSAFNFNHFICVMFPWVQGEGA